MRITSFLPLLFSLLFPPLLFGQMYDPVKWNFKVEDLGNNKAELQLTASIEKGWHVYSQHLPTDEGPLPTEFSFTPSEKYALIGKVEEEKYITEYDPNFEMDLNYFEDEVTWRQKISIKSNEAFQIEGMLTYMVCDEKRCLPPEDVEFSFAIPAGLGNGAVAETSEENNNFSSGFGLGGDEGLLEPVKWSFSQEKLENGNTMLRFQADIDDNWHLYSQHLENDEGPIATSFLFEENKDFQRVGEVKEPDSVEEKMDAVFEMEVRFFSNKVVFEQEVKVLKETDITGSISYMTCDDSRCIFPEPEEFSFSVTPSEGSDKTVTEKAENKDSRSLWGIFIVAFISGFAALLTPCVFPMIPMTVSFFTKQSKTRSKGIFNAILYGLSIIVIYVLLGFGVTKIFGSDALNAMSTNVWFNLAFFVLLIVFAISFFGAFEIVLPSSWVNKADSQADKGGVLGIFFMAFTLAMVSFSCTGPIIGTLLVEAAYIGGNSGPLIGMFGFSLALALPFALFAAFPGWLNSLPQSGGWLNSVKVTLGFLELALAFKFLSNADLVVQAGILTREIFIAIWIAVFGTLAVYLFGKIRMPHDSPIEKLSVSRMLLGVVTLSFTLYLIPGLWGAPLKLISGFPPPMFYSESPNGLAVVQVSGGGDSSIADAHESGSSAHCPHNLNCFHDYDEGMAYAKKENKPVLLDFTGWACVNCRKMEEKVWSDPGVLNLLRNEVVLISLYVDDKRALPEEEQREVEIAGKKRKIKTIGNKWSYFQASRYRSNSQPQYILLDHQEEMLNSPTAYDPDIESYKSWLEAGIEEFKRR